MTQSSAVLRIIEWLSGDACHDCSTAELIEGLGERLRSVGLPVDRLVLHLRTLHPEILGRTLAWSPGEAVEVHDRPHGIELNTAFSNSPVGDSSNRSRRHCCCATCAASPNCQTVCRPNAWPSCSMPISIVWCPSSSVMAAKS